MYTVADKRRQDELETQRTKLEKKFVRRRSKFNMFKGFLKDSGGMQHLLMPTIRVPNPDWKVR